MHDAMIMHKRKQTNNSNMGIFPGSLHYSWQSCRWPVEDAHGYVAKVGSCEASLLWILHEAFSNEDKAKQSRTYMVENFVNDS
jgi:hypothetical protein